MAGLNKEIEQLELQIKFLEIEIQKANTVNVGLQKQLTLTDVSHRRELLKGFMQYVNCTDTTNHIYGHLLEDYLKTL